MVEVVFISFAISEALKRMAAILMGRVLPSVVHRTPSKLQTVTNGVESRVGTDGICHEFAKSRTPDKAFQLRPEDHNKYGGGPHHPPKLHIVIIRRGRERYSKNGLGRAHFPQIHKSIPSVNSKLEVVKQVTRTQPMTLPQGLPLGENTYAVCLRHTGD